MSGNGGFHGEVRADADGSVLVLHGEVDLASAPELERLLAACEPVDVLDVADHGFLDSSGLAVLLRATGVRRLTLRRPSTLVLRILETTGVLDRFEVEP